MGSKNKVEDINLSSTFFIINLNIKNNKYYMLRFFNLLVTI
jgi:hypothetical protein